MHQPESDINGDTTITEAIAILKRRVDAIAQSAEAARFHEDNPSWSNLFRKPYPPYEVALRQYEEALEINEWLNGKHPGNGHLTMKEIFFKMSDQQQLSLFHKRVNTGIASIFDHYLQSWWMSRY